MEPDEARGIWAAFRDNPQWRRLYFARTASLLGNWFNTLAVVHLLGEGEHTSALALAVVFVLKQLPTVIFGPLAGVVADRVDRRKLMIVCDVLDATLALLFLFAIPGESTWLVYVLAGSQITVATFFEPARQAMVPSLVAKRDLVAANALSSATWSIMFALGTALGGVVLATWGWEVAVVVDGLSYLVSALVIATIRYQAPERTPRVSKGWSDMLGFSDVRDGIRYIREDAEVRHVIFAKFSWGFMGAVTLFLTLMGLRPAYHLWGSPDLGVAFLWSMRAVGTGVGPFLARWFSRGDSRRLRRTIAFGYLLAMGCYALLPLSTGPWQAGVLVLVAHIGGSMVWVMSTVLLQQTVPDALRGRTFAAELGLVMATSSLSHVVYGSVLDFGGLPLDHVIWLATAVFAIPVARWIWRDRRL